MKVRPLTAFINFRDQTQDFQDHKLWPRHSKIGPALMTLSKEDIDVLEKKLNAFVQQRIYLLHIYRDPNVFAKILELLGK